MSVLLFSNNATSTLQNAINSITTTIDLAPGTGALFPSPGAGQYFVGTLVDAATGLINEIVNVTSRSGDTLTVVRAQEGTTGQSWNAGDFFNNFWTAGSASAMLQQGQYQQQAANYAVDTGIVNVLAVTLSPAPSSMTLLVGAPIRVKVNITNTAAKPTLNVNALGAHDIIAAGTASTGCGIGTCLAGRIIEVIWDGTNFQYMGTINPATIAQVQTGTDTIAPITSKTFKDTFPGVNSGSGGSGSGGYQIFQNGMIVQWGKITSVTGNGDDVTLPNPFPIAYSVVCNTGTATGAAERNLVNADTDTLASFKIWTWTFTGTSWVTTSGIGVTWLAIGY